VPIFKKCPDPPKKCTVCRPPRFCTLLSATRQEPRIPSSTIQPVLPTPFEWSIVSSIRSKARWTGTLSGVVELFLHIPTSSHDALPAQQQPLFPFPHALHSFFFYTGSTFSSTCPFLSVFALDRFCLRKLLAPFSNHKEFVFRFPFPAVFLPSSVEPPPPRESQPQVFPGDMSTQSNT